MATLSVVCPCYNEEEVLPLFHRELSAVLGRLGSIDCRIIFVDDGSDDSTLVVLADLANRDPRVEYYALSRNFGHQVALTAGLDVAGGDAVLVMDSDLQHPPHVIPAMIDAWQQGSDIVMAVRDHTHGASATSRATSRLFYWLLNLTSGTRVTPGVADFYLLSRRAHQAVLKLRERHRFLRGMVAWVGFSKAFVHFEAPERAAGRSKYSVARKVAFALDAGFSFSSAPIRLMSRLGVLVILLGLVYFVYVVARFFSGSTVSGWSSLMVVLLIIGGTQFVFLGLLGEYMSRVYEQTKERPLYFFKHPPAAGVPPSRREPADPQ